MDCWADMPGNVAAATFFITCSRAGLNVAGLYVNGVIYDGDDAREGQNPCMRGLIWVHLRVDMGPRERAVLCLES